MTKPPSYNGEPIAFSVPKIPIAFHFTGLGRLVIPNDITAAQSAHVAIILAAGVTTGVHGIYDIEGYVNEHNLGRLFVKE